LKKEDEVFWAKWKRKEMLRWGYSSYTERESPGKRKTNSASKVTSHLPQTTN
jgi:hypothetical protein